MNRARVGIAAASILIALVTAAGAALPAQAASDKHLRVRPVAASDDYLVYTQKLATGYSIARPENSTLYFVGKDLKRHPLPGFDPRGVLDIAGDTLVEPLGPAGTDPTDQTTAKHLHWHDLRTGKAGDAALAATDTYAGPALHGWIVKRTTGATGAKGLPVFRVLTISTAGVVRDYGIPYPDGSSFRVVAGPKGLLTSPARPSGGFDDGSVVGDGRARYSPYAHYGDWKTVVDAKRDIDFSCGTPSATHAGCAFEQTTVSGHAGYALLSLRTGKLTWLVDQKKQCWQSAREAYGRTLVGQASSTSPKQHCVRGRLTALTAAGKVANSTRRWGAHSTSTVGLGRILVSKNDQRAIYGLTSVNGTPKLIVRAH